MQTLILITAIIIAYEAPRPTPLDPNGDYPEWIIKRDQEWHRAYDKVWAYHERTLKIQHYTACACIALAIIASATVGFVFGKRHRQIIWPNEARIDKLEGLLRRISGWDMMDSAGDGSYWRKEIKEALGDK